MSKSNKMSESENKVNSSAKLEHKPGDGIRSLRSTMLFRTINFELYAKPNAIIMGIGLVAITGVFGYIAYMKAKYESLGYYTAIQEDGTELFVKKKSKWE